MTKVVMKVMVTEMTVRMRTRVELVLAYDSASVIRV